MKLMHKFFAVFALALLHLSAHAQSNSVGESVEYDPVGNRFLASSSFNSTIVQIDVNGNLSNFGTGLQAHLGMEVMGNHLFAVVGLVPNQPVQTIKAYDLDTELEVMSLTIPSSNLLNGMTSDGVSKLWITDSQNREVYEIDVSSLANPQYQLVVPDTEFGNTPNGITYDEMNDRLVVASWSDNEIRAIDLMNYQVTTITTLPLTNMDGIDTDEDGNFYLGSSSPNTRITKYSNDFTVSETIQIPGVSNPTDLCYANEIKMLAIPSFQHDVVLHSLSPVSIADLEPLETDVIQAFPNPSTGDLQLNLSMLQWEEIRYQVFNLTGRVVHEGTLRNQAKPHLDLNALANGPYTVQFVIDQKYAQAERIVITR